MKLEEKLPANKKN